MDNKPTIAFRVSEGQKTEWEKYADNNDEYDSLSHLIRVAVSHEMSDQYGPNGNSSTVEGTGSSEQIGELVTAVNKMQTRLEDVEDAVQDATEAAYKNQSTPQGFPSYGEILSVIPEKKNNALPADEIARRLDLDINVAKPSNQGSRLAIVIEELREEGVVSIVEDGFGSSEPRYYRTEE
jgi:cell fate (sporulation/competence/biofilm development) regulator YlbF (YheA/YmcA/DUF963 family)